ncbi:MAG: type II toxin-antitoxin system RelE/ParE family toxin [Cephaloticoccus sp.]|nr:type II toxin-antitoxin system RelE/ParE family toxin [Cephaloticoccus sp.]MCF7759579.1 type II toxin-antitoxin system RelE/ParE family toxin [Cephaloticoccus sp.]
MARIIWSTPALAQLEAIATAIEVDKPLVARAVVKQIWTKVERLAEFSAMGRAIPEFRRPGYRQLWVKPCWVYYRASGDEVFILHVRRAEKLLILDDLI